MPGWRLARSTTLSIIKSMLVLIVNACFVAGEGKNAVKWDDNNVGGSTRCTCRRGRCLRRQAMTRGMICSSAGWHCKIIALAHDIILIAVNVTIISLSGQVIENWTGPPTKFETKCSPEDWSRAPSGSDSPQVLAEVGTTFIRIHIPYPLTIAIYILNSQL